MKVRRWHGMRTSYLYLQPHLKKTHEEYLVYKNRRQKKRDSYRADRKMKFG